MYPRQITQNSYIIFGVLLVALVTHLALYAFHVLGLVYPFGNTIYGVSIFSLLFVFIYKNGLLAEISKSKWMIVFILYIALSSFWGFFRFRTFSTSVYDLWLFSYIVILVLIPPYSFNVRAFDYMVALYIFIYVALALVSISLFPNALYDRDRFSELIAHPGMLGSGAVYLLLKYANQLSVLTLIGLWGVVADGILFGVAGAFRGRLILTFLALILFFFLMLKSSQIRIGVKLFFSIAGGIACALAVGIVIYKLGDQLFAVTERFVAISDRYDRTGNALLADARLKEFMYFRDLNPDSKLILGHGVGGLWYDFYGIYGAKIGSTFAGARTMLHMNWAHLTFKIGIVGLGLLITMLVSHWRSRPDLLRDNLSWKAYVIYYMAWTTYYGDKELTVRALVLLMVLINPWLFKIFGPSGRAGVKTRGLWGKA